MATTIWNPDNVKDVAESVGISNLSDAASERMARDVEYRVSQVLEEALKFMRHSKRTMMTTQDISHALRLLDIEPLYGYESTRPLRFGEATMGPGQPLFYVEDDEVDFEKLINTPLPKIPREIAFTAHWLAVEGVQPNIPQNPTAADTRSLDLSAAKGSNANANMAAMSGNENVNVKPLVKHILSKELQLYFQKVCTAFLDESNDEFRLSAFDSLKEDPGLHQLVPYFVQYISEKVTHGLKNLFTLTQIMRMTEALVQNRSLFIDPYVPSLVPPVLTCLIGTKLGSGPDQLAHFTLRDQSASLVRLIVQRYSHSSRTLRPRLARTFLKSFLDPGKPLGTHYGSIRGLQAIGGPDVVRELILANLPSYDLLLKEAVAEDSPRVVEGEKVADALLAALEILKNTVLPTASAVGNGPLEDMRAPLAAKVGEALAARIVDRDSKSLATTILSIQ